MASAFRSVNSSLAADAHPAETMTTSPITPRPDAALQPEPTKTTDDATTPTRATFGAALAAQKPLPTSPFPQAVQVPEASEKTKIPQRENSQHSRKSRDSDDMDMDDSDGETGVGEDGNASDDESVNADGTKGSKKKKSQRFYCTDYPPCNLSFTRSEHLARHIRKHTGERPFQCHCARRFSRLDNLRQHAQTVHVNEDIPIDSLAATGARFQRQIRTDRVRQPGRQRSSTAGSVGGPVRGHSKSLSTSSIASISSIGSGFGPREDVRRRPPPLVMAADPRARLSLEFHRNPVEASYGYRPASPSDFSTPTSATFSTGQSSPRWGSGMASPTSSHSRSQSMYATGTRTPGRRLSVPSGANPFHSPHAAPVTRPLFPGAMNSSNSGAFSPASSSLLSSPTASTSGWSARRDSASNSDEAWRRRTWHPDTRGNFVANASSNLSNVITPNQFQASPAPLPVHNAGQQPTIRLPGIESFDPLPPRPVTPPRRNPSPMMIDSESTANPPALLPAADSLAEDRRSTAQWDMGLHRGLTRLDLTSNTTPPRDSAGEWASQVNQAVQAQAEQVRLNPPTVRFETEPSPSFVNANAGLATRAHHQHTMSAPSIATPREAKRHGWYHGPVTVTNAQGQGEPPADPRTAYVDRMAHPNMNGFTGFPAREQPPADQQAPPNNANPLRGLEALVAVATSEGNTATAY